MKITPDWLYTGPLKFVLGELGWDSFVVGGCVRDAIIGLPVSDIDIATARTPDEVEEIFTGAGENIRLIPTGVDHGTWTVVVDNASFEITTFRKDVETDGRNATVAYARTMGEDAQRRDFTMNALYMDYSGEVLDPTGQGISDLLSRTVRFVGDANERCREDYLRILRLFRFHAKYGKGPMDPAAFWAAADHSAGLSKVSGERIWSELKKLLGLHNPVEALVEMERSGVLERILPGYTNTRNVAAVCYVERTGSLGPSWERRYVALMGYGPHTMNLPHSNKEESHIAQLIQFHARETALVAYALKDERKALDAHVLRLARTGRRWEDPYTEMERGMNAVLPVTARDLMDHGIPAGPQLGKKLKWADKVFVASNLQATQERLLHKILVKKMENAPWW